MRDNRHKPSGKTDRTQIRLDEDERAAIEDAARLMGLPVSSWLRVVARAAAAKQLAEAGKAVPWLNLAYKG